jgi:hypothetical protein
MPSEIQEPAEASQVAQLRHLRGEAALALAGLGWQILPLHSVAEGRCSCGKACGRSAGKHPRTEHGVLDATSDPFVVRHWWRRWPGANVGVATGPASGLWVLGPDGGEGVHALMGLQVRWGLLPEGPLARTGSGGEHWYFRWPLVLEVTNRKNHRRLPIDVRGRGGYVVAPPSVNGKGPYAWERAPWDHPLPEAPGWLLSWLRPPEVTVAVPRRPPDLPDTPAARLKRAIAYVNACRPAVSGQGGHSVTMYVARAVAYGFDLGAEDAFSVLAVYYNPRCQPPWSEKELWHKCQEADRVPFGKPRGWLLGGLP